MKINYVAPCFDSSGYGAASRNYIEALDSIGVDVRVIPITFEKQKPELGSLGDKLTYLSSKKDDRKIQIIHLTPENYVRFDRNNKYNIAYTTWETSKLPDNWVSILNTMQEVWVPCEHNVKVFKDSGVNPPIKCVPHTFKQETISSNTNIPLTNKADDEFMFYSIFQWTERKNPIDLLKAYLTEFKPEEKVCLVIKTYFINPENPNEADQLKQVIKSIKDRLYLAGYPKILLITQLLSTEQIHHLHEKGDCYVSLHRCEGFGIPLVEAMMLGKPVIATSYGGPDDFGPFQEQEIMYKIPYMLTPCHGMPWPTYNGHMNWATPNIVEAKAAMREVFNNQQKAKKMGQLSKQWAETALSYQTIGTLMKDRLEEIERTKF